MTTRSLIRGSLALVLIACGAAAAHPATVGAEQAVTDAEHQWLKSQQTNNVELLAPLLADKVVQTDEQGKVITGRDAVVADAKSTTWSSAEYTDLKVTVFGHTAIATGGFNGKGKSAAGKALDVHARFTDTWIQMDGKWQCVATHVSLLKM